MLARRPDSPRPTGIKLLAGLVLALLVSACTTTGPSERNAKSDARPTPRPLVEVDGEHAFTVTEVVRIDSDVRSDYQSAVAMLNQDRLDEGIELLESVVERAPDLSAPHIALGVAYGRRDDQEKAEQSLRSALSLAPDHPVALNELGIVYRRTGRFDAARQSYEQALAVLPGYHYALRNLGVLCDLFLQDLQCALDSYQAYADIITDDEQVGIWIADIRNRLGVSELEN